MFLLKEFYFNLNFSTRKCFSNHSFNHNFTFSKDRNGKIWFDQEAWIPLKYDTILLKYDTYDKNDNLTMTIQIQVLKINTGIPGSEFVFEISSEAKIINPVCGYSLILHNRLCRNPMFQPK